jgi:hypothetical protein
VITMSATTSLTLTNSTRTRQVTLALGTLRMASRDVIVKQLPVVEALGCVTGEKRLTVILMRRTLVSSRSTIFAVFTHKCGWILPNSDML